MPTQIEIRQRKQEVINKLCSRIKNTTTAPMNINRFWYNKGDETGLKKVWTSRAYFIQDLKRLIGDSFEVISVQKKGTIIKRIKNK